MTLWSRCAHWALATAPNHAQQLQPMSSAADRHSDCSAVTAAMLCMYREL
jgi:hypothetical protein